MSATKQGLSVDQIREGFIVREYGHMIPAERNPDVLVVSGIPSHPYALQTWYSLFRVEGTAKWRHTNGHLSNGGPYTLDEALDVLAEFVASKLED